MSEYLTKKQKKDINEFVSHLLKQTKNNKINWNDQDYCIRTDFNGVRVEINFSYIRSDIIRDKEAFLRINGVNVFKEKWTLFPDKISKKIRKIWEIKQSCDRNARNEIQSKQAQKYIDEAKKVYLIEKLSGLNDDD